MSERERWIVYPLLFLALGAALRDKLIKRSVSEHVICQQLSVIDDQGRPVTVLKDGSLFVFNEQRNPVAALQGGKLTVEQIDAVNLRQMRAASNNNWMQLMRLLWPSGLPARPAQPRLPNPAPPQAPAEDAPAEAPNA